jgi:predicted DNA binding protein
MSKSFNGQRLRQARLYKGLSINDLAELLGVSKQAISQYETSNVTPDFDKMRIITNELNFPSSYFFQEDSFDVNAKTTYFRALLSANKNARLQQVVKIKHLAMIYEILSNYLEFPQLNIPDVSEFINNNEIDYEAMAQKIREYWEIGQKPIEDFPYLLEKNGIIVASYPVSQDNIDAYSQKINVEGNDKFIIVLSDDKNSAVRSNFDAAHELGHILLHDWNLDLEELSREDFKKQEKQANNFAAAFLLPKEAFLKDVSLYPKDLKYYIELKRKWKVSISAMLIRANKLGVINDNQYQYLMKQMTFNKWRQNEPLDNVIIKQEPILLNKSIEMLIGNNVFNPQEFLDELAENNISMKADEVEKLLNLPEGTLSPREEKNIASIVNLKKRTND